MIIHPLEIVPYTEGNKNGVSARAFIEWRGGHHNLQFSVEDQFSSGIKVDRLDAFVVAAVLRAMHEGEDIEVRGSMSARLLYNLVNHWIPITSGVLPGTKRISIEADRLITKAEKRPKGTATGYSAGIDSFAVIHDHLFSTQPEGFKITHFLFNNVGSHAGDTRNQALFQQRLEKIKAFSERVGVPIIEVNSTFGHLVPFDFMKSHPARNASVPLLLQGLIGRWYYASANRYTDCHTGPCTEEISHENPSTIHLFSTDTLDCISTGSQYSRVEKTHLVATHPETYNTLNVCAGGKRAILAEGKNCSVCFKCCRTLFTLELMDSLDLYTGVFNMEAYRQARFGYLFDLLLIPNEPLNHEILELARERNFRFPRILVFAATLARPFGDQIAEFRRRRGIANL